MRGKRRVLATLVIGELMFAFGEGWSSSEPIYGSGFWTGFSAFPQGKISQERPRAARHECVTRAGPIAPKLPILRGSLLARSPSIVRHARFRESAQSGGASGLLLRR